MQLVQSCGAVLYDRASAAGLSFLVFAAPPPGSEEAWEWDHTDRRLGVLGLQLVCKADPHSLQHAVEPMLAGLPAHAVAGVVMATKDDPQMIPQVLDPIRRDVGNWLVEMAEHATTAPIIPFQGTPSGFQSLAGFASQLRVDAGALIGVPPRSPDTPILVVLSQKATVLVKSTTPGPDEYINHNLLDEYFRRVVMKVRVLMKAEFHIRR